MPSSVGGCGPAVLLCVPDGGAASGACAGHDLTRPPRVLLPDGGTVRGFYRLTDGGIGGGWPEPGDPDGPPDEGWIPPGVPAADWEPDAGIRVCPVGWPRLADGTCDPRLRVDCPEGSGALPGGHCTPTAEVDCPAGEYAELGPEALGARVVQVRAGADVVVADGSIEHPYATVMDGVRNAGPGGWVRVAAGEYRERIVVTGGVNVHVVGVCAARVTVRGPGPEGRGGAAVDVSNGGSSAATALELRGLTVSGDGRGLQVEGAATLRASAVRVTGCVEVGVFARGSGARLELAASVVRATRTNTSGHLGRAVGVQSGASLLATRVRFEDNRSGIAAFDPGTRAELEGSVVRGGRGPGVIALEGATLRVVESVIEENGEQGIAAQKPGTTVEVVRCIVRGTLPRTVRDGATTQGQGLAAFEAATVRVSETLFADNTQAGVAATSGAVVEFAQSVVRGTRSLSDGTEGHGVVADSRATVRVVGVRIEDDRGEGAVAQGVDSVVEIVSSVVDGVGGSGLRAQDGGTIHATRALLVDTWKTGVVALDAKTTVTLTESVVREILSRSSVVRGRGVEVNAGATLHVLRSRVAGTTDIGISAFGEGTRADVEGSIIEGTRPLGTEGGHGLDAGERALLSVVGSRVEGNTEAGISANHAGTVLEVRSCVVRDTRAGLRHGGYGLAALRAATLRATAVLVVGSSEAGVGAGLGGSVEMAACRVRDTRTLSDGLAGIGLVAFEGGLLRTTGVAVESNIGQGVFVLQPGSRAELVASVVRDTRTRQFGEDRTMGRAFQAMLGASLRATGVLLAGNAEAGLSVSGSETRVTLEDTVISGVAPSGRGFGVGVIIVGGGQVDGTRLAIQNVHGGGVLLTSREDNLRARATLRDLFVRGVTPREVGIALDNRTVREEGPRVAYGLHTGRDATLDAERAVIDRGGFGFYNAGGVIRIRQGVIANQTQTVGAVDLATGASATTREDVAVRNTRDAVERRPGLPSVAPLPSPPPIRHF